MPRENDAQRKQTRAGTNPVQQLRSEVQKIKHEDQGPVPPPQPPHQAGAAPVAPPSQQGSAPEPQTEAQPQPELPQELVEGTAPVDQQTTNREVPTPFQQAADLEEEHFRPSPPRQPMMIPQGVPAMQDLLFQVMNQQRTQNQKFHLVIVPDDAQARVRSFDQVEDMIREMQEYLDTDTSLFPFLGDLMRISKGPNRYLQTPMGVLPLFVLPKTEELEFEPDGFVGKPAKDLEAPAGPDDDDEEEFDEPITDSPATAETPQRALPAVDDDDTPVLPSSAEG